MTDKEKIQNAIKQLKSIPPNQFITDDFTNRKDKCCSWGHLNRLSNDPVSYDNKNCNSGFGDEIDNIIYQAMQRKTNMGRTNDKPSVMFPQKKSKTRVLALLQKVESLL